MTIEGPSETQEGTASGEFKATLTPSTPDASEWKWSFEQVAGAGNNPDVPFASPAAKTTTVTKAHWFALPDHRDNAPPSCTYTLVCEATVNGRKIKGTKSWTVWIDPNGGLTAHAKLTGEVAIASKKVTVLGKEQTVWYVSGMGSLARTPAVITKLPPTTSQFYAKIKAHEDEHARQWNQGGWLDYWDPTRFFNTVQNLQNNFGATGEQRLRNQINDYRKAFDTKESARVRSTAPAREAGAHQISDGIAPNYRLHNTSGH